MIDFLIRLTIVFFLVFFALNYYLKLYNKEYDSNKLSHKLSLAAVFVACTGIATVIFCLLSTESLEYPYENPLFSMNAYEQMFDAFLKHQLNIDITPDSMLAQLNDPYDWDERQLYDFAYLWDRVYFNNKYYSYFGTAPILLIYFPFYFITKKVPTAPTVCFILSLVAITAIFFLVIKLYKVFFKKINLAILIFSVLAAETGSLIFMSQASADFYYIAVSSGIAFLALFLLFSFCAYDSKKVSTKCIHFALSGISLVFLVMSRPNLAMYFLIAIPIYLSVLLSKEIKLSEKIKQVVSFAVPVTIGAVIVMWYNYARFGSILEFGANYQLTVYNVSKYTFSPALIAPAIYYYFFQYPKFTKVFPYINIPYLRPESINSYDGYIYIASTIGAFSFPSVWGIACLPASLKNKNFNNYLKSIMLISAASVIIMAIFDMCYAGVNIRYLADIALICVLFSNIALHRFVDMFNSGSEKIKFAIHSLVCLLLFLTFALGAYLILCNERDYLINLGKIKY